MKFILSFVYLLLVVSGLYAQPMPTHNLVFSKLAVQWDEAVPLGNGTVGALIWQKDSALRFSLDRSDLWDERPMKGLHRKEFSYQWVYEQVKKKEYEVVQQYFDAPYDKEAAPSKIPGGVLQFDIKNWGKVDKVEMKLANAVCEVRWQNGTFLKTFVHATQPVGWFRFENLKQDFIPELLTPNYVRKDTAAKVPGNDVSKLGYQQGQIKKSANTITYLQKGWNGFEYSITVSWKKMGKNTVEGVWSISSNFYNTNSSAAFYVKTAMRSSFKKALQQHSLWWQQYWSKSAIQLQDAQIEKQWYLAQYLFGSTARRGAPPILLQGVWTADNGRLPPWKGDYHHDLNTQLSYWPAYSSNHLEEALSYTDHLDANKAVYKKYTKLFFGTDGLAVPGVTTLKGTEMGGWIQYALSPTISAWLAHHYYLQWRYSMDTAFLVKSAYPWFKEVALHLEQLTYLDSNGHRRLPISSSPEINNNKLEAWFLQNTNYDLALMKFVFTKAAELAAYLGKATESAHYKNILNQFGDFALTKNNELKFAPDLPYMESHRHFSNALAIHPLGLIKWEDGDKAKSIIKNTIHLLDSIGPDNWNGYSYAWLANIKAWAKDGEGALKALQTFSKAFVSVNGFHVNGDQSGSGFSKRTYRPFTLEGNFAFAAGLQEMLLQSYAGYINIMPAIPAVWQNVSFKNLRAEGAFLVSANKVNGSLERIEIFAEKAGKALVNIDLDQWQIASSKNVNANKKGSLTEFAFKQGGQIVLTKGFKKVAAY